MTQIYALAKLFDQPEYLDDFRKGHLFMRKLKEFSEMEEEKSDKRGDKCEGISFHYQPGQHKIILDGQEITDMCAPTIFSTNKVMERFVFCMYSVNSGNYKTFTEAGLDDFKNSLKINENAAKLGQEMLLILNCEEFIRRMRRAFNRQKISYSYGLVRYFDSKTFHGEIKREEVGFWKRNIYQDQNEYRIIAEIPSTKSTLLFDVGDISDITQVTSPKEFNEKMTVSFDN